MLLDFQQASTSSSTQGRYSKAGLDGLLFDAPILRHYLLPAIMGAQLTLAMADCEEVSSRADKLQADIAGSMCK